MQPHPHPPTHLSPAHGRLYELAALISAPGSRAQPLHADFPYREGEGAAIVIAFVALQDVEPDMGPTDILPRTHTAEAHARFNGAERLALVRECPNTRGLLATGDANVIDARTLHCGGGNDSLKRRVLFYCSFLRRGRATAGTHSLLPALRSAGYALDNTEEWVYRASEDKPESETGSNLQPVGGL